MATKKRTRVKHASRTTIVDMINGSKGKIFTVTFTKKNGKERVMNCNKKDASTTRLGYILVWDMKKHANRTIDPRTITSLKYQGKTYQIQ